MSVRLFAVATLICLSVISSVHAQTTEDAEGYYNRKKVSVVEVVPVDELSSKAQFKERINNENIGVYENVEIKIKASDTTCQATITNVTKSGRAKYIFQELEFEVLANCGKNKKAIVFIEIWASSENSDEWKKKLWIYKVRPIGSKGEQTPFSKWSWGNSSSSSSSTTIRTRTWRWRSW